MTKKASVQGESLAGLLDRLERWLARHRRNFLKGLQPGASPAEFDTLQKQLGQTLPQELRTLLSWHNGQGDSFIGGFEQDWLLMDCQSIAASKSDLDQDPAAGWHPAWIPFLDNDAGDFLFLDTSPTQAPVCWFSLDQTEKTVLAPSLESWLRDFVENVEKGNYVEDPERGTFQRQ